MPFSRRGKGLRNVFRELKPRKFKRVSTEIVSSKRIRVNSNDVPTLDTKEQIRSLSFKSHRQPTIVEDRIDEMTGNLKMPCWMTGGCDD